MGRAIPEQQRTLEEAKAAPCRVPVRFWPCPLHLPEARVLQVLEELVRRGLAERA